MGPDWPKIGPGGFFPTNPDLADILGRTDFDFENLFFLDFVGPKFLAWAQRRPTHLAQLEPTHLGPPTWARLGPSWARVGPSGWAQAGPSGWAIALVMVLFSFCI